jgi:2,3-dihydro-2,3-dihydroxybenzoate dehydrogenase
LKDAVAVITGGGRGIGAGIADALAEAGGKPVLIDIDPATLAQTAGALQAKDAAVTTHCIDITDGDAVTRTIDAVASLHGRIDGLVNAAGILHLQDILALEPAAFERVMRVNVFGTFLISQAVARKMAVRKRGSIVTIASVAAHAPRARQAAYCTSKAAVAHLMRAFALELAPLGIRCNSVSPGPTETDMIREVIRKAGSADRLLRGVPDEFRVGIPIGRLAQVADIARTVLFLLSDDSAYTTMQDIVVDGGHTLGA